MSDDTEGGICCPMDVYLKQWLKHVGNAKDSNDWGDSSATGLRRMEAACKALGADYVALLGCSSVKHLLRIPIVTKFLALKGDFS